MREIKFRAWDKSAKQMLNYSKLDTFIDLEGTVYQSATKTYDTPNHEIEFAETNLILMQYTGLKDKNSKEVYEGDIIWHTRYKSFYDVIWSDGGWCVKSKIHSCAFTNLCRELIELKGNVHENQELKAG